MSALILLLATFTCIKSCVFANEEFPTEILKFANKQPLLVKLKIAIFCTRCCEQLFFWVNLFDRFFCHFYKFKLHKFIQKLKSILAWFNTSKFSFVAVGVNSDVFTFSFQSQFWRSIFHSRVNSDVCFFCVFSVFFIRFNFPKVDHNVLLVGDGRAK